MKEVDDRKVKFAFFKVKEDIVKLKEYVERVEKKLSQRLKEDESSNDFVLDINDSVMTLRSDLNRVLKENFEHNESSSRVLDNFDKKLALIREDVDVLRRKQAQLDVKEPVVDSVSSKVDFKAVEDLVDEKINVSLSSFEKEFKPQSEDNLERDFVSRRAMDELNDMIQGKIDMEVANLRAEFVSEMAKYYDNAFREIVELKGEVVKLQEKSKSNSDSDVVDILEEDVKTENYYEKEVVADDEDEFYKSQVEDLNSQKEPSQGKFKKITKWLFEDEDIDQLEGVKKEVNKK